MKIINKFPLALQVKGTAARLAALCLVCVLLFAVDGCQQKIQSLDDETTFKDDEIVQEDWDDIRVNILPPEELPEFFQDDGGRWYAYYWKMYADPRYSIEPIVWQRLVEYYRGVWKNDTIYLFTRGGFEIFLFSKDGESIDKSNLATILEESKNKELIFQIVNGVVTPPTSGSDYVYLPIPE
jgi:hypothetical protein